MWRVFGLCVLLIAVCTVGVLHEHAVSYASSPQLDNPILPPTYIPSGKQMYRQYCAACHGAEGNGHGPISPLLLKVPPNLTTLARRHDGEFPREYVTNILRFGPGFAAHGSSDMPVWGPIFQSYENYNEAAVRQRIKNLCDFLESIQEK